MSTLGEVCPALKQCKPRKKSRRELEKEATSLLKTLYPEVEPWTPVYVLKSWQAFLQEKGRKPEMPKEREEAFPAFLVKIMREKMVELGHWK